MDLMPTFLKLAGIDDWWKNGGQSFDGVDIAPLLFENQPLETRPVFWRMRDDAAVRQGPWKLVILDDGKPQLFNLKSDPGETYNLAASQPKRVAELHKALRGWARDVDSNVIK